VCDTPDTLFATFCVHRGAAPRTLVASQFERHRPIFHEGSSRLVHHCAPSAARTFRSSLPACYAAGGATRAPRSQRTRRVRVFAEAAPVCAEVAAWCAPRARDRARRRARRDRSRAGLPRRARSRRPACGDQRRAGVRETIRTAPRASRDHRSAGARDDSRGVPRAPHVRRDRTCPHARGARGDATPRAKLASRTLAARRVCTEIAPLPHAHRTTARVLVGVSVEVAFIRSPCDARSTTHARAQRIARRSIRPWRGRLPVCSGRYILAALHPRGRGGHGHRKPSRACEPACFLQRTAACAVQ
jgi:hypothetical protein